MSMAHWFEEGYEPEGVNPAEDLKRVVEEGQVYRENPLLVPGESKEMFDSAAQKAREAGFIVPRIEAVWRKEGKNPNIIYKDMHKSVEDFSVKTIQIAGFCAALQALRLPFSKEMRSEAHHEFTKWNDRSFTNNASVDINDDDMRLLSTLVKRGDEHAKVLRGVMVWCEINAPRYWHVEMDTYRIGCERLSSESTMHVQGRGLSEDELVAMKEKLREGTMQRRVWMFSYQTLRRIYRQRKDHRLPQWRMFCQWIETLPFANELILTQ